MVCKQCGSDRPRIRTEQKHGAHYKYIDDTGRMWRRRYCPDCKNTLTRLNNYSRGVHRPIDLVDSPITRKGRESELKVKAYLESLGRSVAITAAQGPDLIVDNELLIEVKTLVRSKSGFTCSPVGKNRKADNYIALVLGDLVIFEKMRDHLKKCAPTGMRYFTKPFIEGPHANPFL